VNFSKVATITVYGKPTGTGCWNHPEYIGFWRATVEDIFRSYDVDGFQWGAERASPLANIIQNGNDTSATCFCQFCRARGKAAGIDPDRAREGMEQVLKYVQTLRAYQAGAKPAERRHRTARAHVGLERSAQRPERAHRRRSARSALRPL
jgi:hypothetical protein